MPRLPQFTDLNNVSPQAARGFVDLPTPDISGGFNALAAGVGAVGDTIDTIQKDREEKARKQERFDTKMALIGAEEAYANSVKDLDPLDPEYVEKKRTARRETFKPVLENVKDPDNRQFFEESTFVDYTNIGIKAEGAQRTAFAGKNKLEINSYTEAQRQRLAAGEDPSRVYADVQQMIQDAPHLTALEKMELEQTLLPVIDMDAAEGKAIKLHTGGGGAQDKAAAVLRKFEGFRATPYWDENADRVGYGSDTVTLADGTVVKVTKGMTITKADAERDLQRRTAEFMSAAAKTSGPAWDNLSPDQQAALTSVAYNYGSLPKRVVTAIQAGDANAIANAVESLSDHNGGVNRKRREAEAALIRGASIPAEWAERPKLDDILTQTRQDPSYLRLGVDQRAKVEASIVSRYEKFEKETEKTTQINTARDAANYAAGSFETIAEAYQWIDQNVADPETREKARTMAKSEFEANEKSREAEYKQLQEKVFVDVENAVESGDTAAAWVAIPEGLDFADQIKLRDRIKAGKVRSDDPTFLDELDAMKLGSKEDRKRFADFPLGGGNQFRLTRETRNKILKEQDDMRKSLENGGDVPSLAAPGELFKARVATLGIDDPAMTERLKAMYQRNLQTAASNKGSNLTPVEHQDILDTTFMQFREEGRGTPFVTVEEVLTKFSSADEMQGVPDGTNYNLAVTRITEAAERQKVELEKQILAIESRARSPKYMAQYFDVSEYAAARGQLDALNQGGFITGAALDDWLQRSLGKKADPDAVAAAQKAAPPPGRQNPADAAEYAAAEERQRQAEEREAQVDPNTPAGRVATAREQFGLDNMRDAEIIQFLKDRGSWPFGN